jgi:hypothetical protein
VEFEQSATRARPAKMVGRLIKNRSKSYGQVQLQVSGFVYVKAAFLIVQSWVAIALLPDRSAKMHSNAPDSSSACTLPRQAPDAAARVDCRENLLDASR